jgi:hypothetical protein
MPRTKGSRTGNRQTPHPLIQLHKHSYVETLEDLCKSIFPKNSLDVAKVLEAVKGSKLAYGRMQQMAEELNVEYNRFNAIIRRLKDLGILTKDYMFSEMFQNKITSLSTFYAHFHKQSNSSAKSAR